MRDPAAPPSSLPRPVIVASQLLIFLIICVLLYWGRFVLVPISLAILCAFVLYPVVRLVERRRIKRAPAVIVAMALALGSVGGLTWIFGSQLADLLAEAPKYRENIKEKIAGLRGVATDNTISNLQKTIRQVEEELDRETPVEPEVPSEPSPEEAVPVMVVTEKDFFNLSLEELSPYLNGLFHVALVVILTGLFLYWREDLVERLVGLSGRTRMVVTTNALTDAGSRISRFLALQLAVNLLYGVIAGTGLYLLGVPYAVVWGGFAAVLRYIPYVGSILGTSTASLAALVLLPGWEPVLYVTDVPEQVQAMNGLVPTGVLVFLEEEMRRLTSSSHSLSWPFAISVVLTLWSASRAHLAIGRALDVAYGEHSSGGLIATRIRALALATMTAFTGLVSLGLLVIVPRMGANLGDGPAWMVDLIRWPLIALVFWAWLTVVYRYGPSRRPPKWQWLPPGAILATALWLTISALLSWYAAEMVDLGKTYGSLGSVVLLLLWLYGFGFALLLGAEFDAEIEHQTVLDSTSGPDRPPGERGAYVADNVGRPKRPADSWLGSATEPEPSSQQQS